ncbi:uncharacterized protein EI97DRAFT_438768 [Westerdykella ornata]|uniref:Uncharacterized protein n=1 Tax=Westerdykella ornata TaxID=318751 RepID=A0A6A6JXR9_WESOR|nr:uncharacterized protein EI97DRAFT_438768 [Westerdykella ornata]KAF2281412.1 hypothetical protein EI97DRAFT_438768 [Westerdykella ornata]
MCQALKIIFSCTHTATEVQGRLCNQSTQLLESRSVDAANRRPLDTSRSLCPEVSHMFATAHRTVHASEDCGNGSPFMSCVQRQSLDYVREGVLRLCEQKSRSAFARLARKHKRLLNLKSHLRQEPSASANDQAAYTTLAKLISDALQRYLMIFQNLNEACRRCGHVILVRNGIGEGPNLSIETLAELYGAPINLVIWEGLPHFEEVVLGAEKEIREAFPHRFPPAPAQ